MSYLAFELSEASRQDVLRAFPPRFPDVICDHVTLIFGIPATYDPNNFEPIETVRVVGYVVGDGIEAIVVTINGSMQRKDGRVYHVTLSLDRSKGRKPVDSNQLIANSAIIPVDYSQELTGEKKVLI